VVIPKRIWVVYGVVVETSGLPNEVLDETSAGKQDGQDKNDALVEVTGFWPLKELTTYLRKCYIAQAG
jgi:hypothetical protein